MRICLGAMLNEPWRLGEEGVGPCPFSVAGGTSHRTSLAQSSEVYCALEKSSLRLRRRCTLSARLERLSRLVGLPLSGVVARVDGGPEEDTQLLFEEPGAYDPAAVDVDDDGTRECEDEEEAVEDGRLAGEGYRSDPAVDKAWRTEKAMSSADIASGCLSLSL